MSDTAGNFVKGLISVHTVKGEGGLPKVVVKTQHSTAEIYLQGAHVTSFHRQGDEPLLFMSRECKYAAGTALRGGIPVIFPWFGPKAGTASHGYARTTEWQLAESKVSPNGSVTLTFQLPVAERETGIQQCDLKYTVAVGERLDLKLQVTNLESDKPLAFEECLHTYFMVGDISEVSVRGLQGTQYLDKVNGGIEKTETLAEFRIESEVDRVYLDTPATVEIIDHGLKRTIFVVKSNSRSTVVWNPWIDKSKALADFGDDEYHEMICVESGNVNKNSMTLKPGESSEMAVTLYSVPVK